MIWVVLIAIIVGLVLGRLMGFMAVEFVARPLAILLGWGTGLFAAIAAWDRRL